MKHTIARHAESLKNSNRNSINYLERVIADIKSALRGVSQQMFSLHQYKSAIAENKEGYNSDLYKKADRSKFENTPQIKESSVWQVPFSKKENGGLYLLITERGIEYVANLSQATLFDAAPAEHIKRLMEVRQAEVIRVKAVSFIVPAEIRF